MRMPVELPRHERHTRPRTGESIRDTIDTLQAIQVVLVAVRMTVLDRVGRSPDPQ